jgi:homogentisate 1,2-dioxygenase
LAALFSNYGHLRIETSDYVIIPRGTMWRIEPDGELAAFARRGDERQLPAPATGDPRPVCQPRSGPARYPADGSGVSRNHLPPSVHTTFVANRFGVCTFVPRPFATAPSAIKVPFFQNNDDYDEVIFHHAGNVFSRDNIKPGMMTLHLSGFTHGPHPKAYEDHARAEQAGHRRVHSDDRCA